MLFEFWKKQSKNDNKIKLLKSLIAKLKIPEAQKKMYLGAIEVLDDNELDNFYNKFVDFVKSMEIEKISDIQKNNFASINGLRKKEAEEQKEELNSLNLLLDNI